MVNDDVLGKFYKRIAERGTVSLSGVPESTVFFVRRGIESKSGVLYPLEHVAISLFLQGRLDPDKYYKNGLPQWYVDKYLGGKHPDMEKLRRVLRAMFAVYTCLLEFNSQRLERQISDSEELKVSEADTGEVPPF